MGKKIKTPKVMTKGKRKAIKTIYNILIAFFGIVFLGCSIYLGNYFYQSKKSEAKVDKLRDLIVDVDEPSTKVSDGEEGKEGEEANAQPEIEFVKVEGKEVQKKFEKLYRRNKDFIGWLKIDGTVIDYPVMQTPSDEEFYIDHDFDKEYSSAGTLFINASSDLTKHNDNIIIYGHNMKTGKMFHGLVDYEEESFYNSHKTFKFDTIYGNGTYEVIAAFRTKIYEKDYEGFKYYQFFEAQNKQDFDVYVNSCKSLTSYPIPTKAEFGDELLTLSTCAYHDDEGRFVVVAKKIK